MKEKYYLFVLERHVLIGAISMDVHMYVCTYICTYVYIFHKYSNNTFIFFFYLFFSFCSSSFFYLPYSFLPRIIPPRIPPCLSVIKADPFVISLQVLDFKRHTRTYTCWANSAGKLSSQTWQSFNKISFDETTKVESIPSIPSCNSF